uniref:Uncharacterized protein n=1 Tax=Anguilla anguilla TaxID=7936 RepID=A0A0E9UII6_ANGAN
MSDSRGSTVISIVHSPTAISLEANLVM